MAEQFNSSTQSHSDAPRPRLPNKTRLDAPQSLAPPHLHINTWRQIFDLLQTGEDHTQRIAALAAADSRVRQTLLRMVNAVGGGLRRPVTDLSQAIGIIGFRRLEQFATQQLLDQEVNVGESLSVF